MMLCACAARGDQVPVSSEPPEDTPQIQSTENIIQDEPSPDSKEEEAGRAVIQVLMYHHLSPDPSQGMTVSPERFEEQLSALLNAGYETVSIRQLVEFVESGVPLPEKTVVLTFDDGYYSNLEYAVPVLEKYSAQATIFAIGVSAGKSKYKDTGLDMLPHFSYEQAMPAVDSGTISVQSHTYDMHQAQGYDDPVRESVLRMENESAEEYEQALETDFTRSFAELEAAFGEKVIALAYPLGKYSEESERILTKLGVPVSFRVKDGATVLEQGNNDSLRLIDRYTVTEEMSGEYLTSLLDNGLSDEQERLSAD